MVATINLQYFPIKYGNRQKITTKHIYLCLHAFEIQRFFTTFVAFSFCHFLEPVVLVLVRDFRN